MSHARRDVVKLLLFAAVVVACGALLAPFAYNAALALSEVTAHKQTNGPLEWLGKHGGRMGFPMVFAGSVLAVAVLLFLPWVELLSLGERAAGSGDRRPWLLTLPAARDLRHGQPLRKRAHVWWEGFAAFLLSAGFLLPAVLLQAGELSVEGAPSFGSVVARYLPLAVLAAIVAGGFFGGVIFGIFVRAVKPWSAIVLTACMFTLAAALLPRSGVGLPDADVPLAGFALLREIGRHLLSPDAWWSHHLPVFALGLLLMFARWRTASLALPTGLLTTVLFLKIAPWKLAPLPDALVWFALLILGVIAVVFSPKAEHGETVANA